MFDDHEYVARCPECAAEAVGREGQPAPGHLHDMGDADGQRFVQYVKVRDLPPE